MKRLREEEQQAAPQPVVAFYAHKGGVGKTTSCLTMAVCAAQKGLRVMLLDCDPQHNATAFLSQWQNEKRFDYEADYRAMASNYRLDQVPRSELTQAQLDEQKQYALQHRNLFDLLTMDASQGYTPALAALPSIGYRINEHLSVVAAHPMLSAYDMLLGYEVAQRGFAADHMARLGWLLRFLLDGRFDLVLLDLAPSNSLFNQMALASCSHFVMPLTGDRFALQSLETLDLMLALMDENFSRRLDPHCGRNRPARVPQLLCLLYGQYKAGDAELPMDAIASYTNGSVVYCGVSEDDAQRCREIGGTLRSHEKSLARFMDLERVMRQLVLIQCATELYRKLGHANRTVFDDDQRPTMTLVTPLVIERLNQRQEYDILWGRMQAILFPTREWH